MSFAYASPFHAEKELPPPSISARSVSPSGGFALRNIREKMFISSLTPSFCFLPLQCLYFPAFMPLEKVACVVHHFSFLLPLYHGGALCLSMLPPSCSGVLFTVLAAFHIKNQQKTC
ncbi:MAG: hypothetical protein ACLT3H_00680 [Roseburia sp.]|jgi:hypothetical protein